MSPRRTPASSVLARPCEAISPGKQKDSVRNAEADSAAYHHRLQRHGASLFPDIGEGGARFRCGADTPNFWSGLGEFMGNFAQMQVEHWQEARLASCPVRSLQIVLGE